MSKVLQCDICGSIEPANIRTRIRIKTVVPGWRWKWLDVCDCCLLTIRDLVKQRQQRTTEGGRQHEV